MPLIDLLLTEPALLQAPLPIEVQRPRSCLHCGRVAGAGPVLLFHGHGLRSVLVVLPPQPDLARARLVRVVVRRFVCKACRRTRTVYPPGVLPRYLYSLLAVVSAWILALEPPLGEGLDQLAVYARQGVDRLSKKAETHRTGRIRWRSLARWATRIEAWWPHRAVMGTTWRQRVRSLLSGFVAEAQEPGLAGLLQRALTGHAGRGAAV